MSFATQSRAAVADRDALARAVLVGLEAELGPGRPLFMLLDDLSPAPYSGLNRVLGRISSTIGSLQHLGDDVVLAVDGDRIIAVDGSLVRADLRMTPSGLVGTVDGTAVEGLPDLVQILGPPEPARDSVAAVARRTASAERLLLDGWSVDRDRDRLARSTAATERSVMPFIVATAVSDEGSGPAVPSEIRLAVANAFGAWWAADRPDMLPEALRGRPSPGRATYEALDALAHGSTRPAGDESLGSGPLLWCAPLGLRATWTVEDAFEVAREAAGVTHSAAFVRNGAAVVAAVVRMLVAGRSPSESVSAARQLLVGRRGTRHGTADLYYLLGRLSDDDQGDRVDAPIGGRVDQVLRAVLAEFVAPRRPDDPVGSVRRMCERPGEGRTAAVLLAQFYGARGIRIGDDRDDAEVTRLAAVLARRLAGAGGGGTDNSREPYPPDGRP